MRGDKRVAVRFNLAARKAADTAVHEDYVKKFEVSDNLKYALSDDTASNEKPLGRNPSVPAAGSTSVAASTQR
jgi:hypothetical protein